MPFSFLFLALMFTKPCCTCYPVSWNCNWLCNFFCRAANVFSCAYLVNLVRPAPRQIPVKHQKALWYSGRKSSILWFHKSSLFLIFARFNESLVWVGLRGAMAFALALQSVHDLPEGHGQTIFTATTAIVVLTVGKLTLIKSKLPVFFSFQFILMKTWGQIIAYHSIVHEFIFQLDTRTQIWV